ncbi:MAG TPA: GvpL/GvpF family gas vesicle protein [Solirubrobacteraceae bacterium]|nr:GvpL/GvpF family gas vesicle protein [Solirubrobacteraceae bacterium]
MSTDSATYVYGVVAGGSRPPKAPGIGGAELKLVRADDVAALVSDIGSDELTFGREAMTAHAQVLEAALEVGTVLPMRFGIVLPGEDAVRADLLQGHEQELRQQLQELAGKVELKLRATYDEPRLMREVVAEDAEVAHLRDSLRGAPEDATYYARIRLGELVAAGVERKRQADGQAILDLLSPLALGVEVSDPAHERIVLSASFLVDADRIAEFDEAVEGIGRAQAERMRLKYTGPLPPHSFVELSTAEV